MSIIEQASNRNELADDELADDELDDEDDEADDDETSISRSVSPGSFLVGIAAGWFGGLLLAAMVLRYVKPETRRGIHWGLLLHVLFVFLNLFVR